MISRRRWLQSIGGATVGAVVARASFAQQGPGVAGVPDTSNLFAMDQSAARSVRLPPKPGALPSMSPDERDALEHQIRCQCGCTLDVFTCRTTDFSCQVSPAMHRDIMALVEGGYGAREILDSFQGAYGERVLMAPPRKGFNLVGYVMPGLATAVGAVMLAFLLKRWKRAPAAASGARVPTVPQLQATPEELARLDAAIRDDS